MNRFFTKGSDSANAFVFASTCGVGLATFHYLTCDQDQDKNGSVDSVGSFQQLVQSTATKIMFLRNQFSSNLGSSSGTNSGASADSSNLRPMAREVRYTIDENESKLNFHTKHLQYLDVDGTFSKFTGDIVMKYNGHDIDEAIVTKAEVDASTIDTQSWLRDRRMRNEFLEVHKFPKFVFEGQKLIPVEGRPFQTYTVLGKICIRDIWKDVELQVQIEPNTWGKDQIRGNVKGVLNRFDFDILPSWPEFTVAKNVDLNFTIVANAQTENAKKETQCS